MKQYKNHQDAWASSAQGSPAASASNLEAVVERLVSETPITDIHTHLYSADFGPLVLWGVDELLVYHYLVAESTRVSDEPFDAFWAMSKREQADWIWQKLFIDRSPISEATTGVLTVFRRMGLDLKSRDLNEYRAAWAKRTLSEQIDLVLQAAGVKELVMTNDPLDPVERGVWLTGGNKDSRFHAALRVDPLLNDWPRAAKELQNLGYHTEEAWTEGTISETKRFLEEWIGRMDALYVAVSMPGDFAYPADDHRTRMIDEVIIPVCSSLDIPFALMIGVKRQVNPSLRLAGDMSMISDVAVVEALCRRYPDNRFLVTMLARENQHDLAVLARKFRNLMVFGCWWFLNIESMIEEITRLRVELLGTSMIPQHSDSRILEQLVYKWDHSRAIIGRVLFEKYLHLEELGWQVSEEEIRRDVEDLFSRNFWRFVRKKGGDSK